MRRAKLGPLHQSAALIGVAVAPLVRYHPGARRSPRRLQVALLRNAGFFPTRVAFWARNGLGEPSMYTLSDAARATGRNKSTIQRAIKRGTISAGRDEMGEYVIDPAELHRVYPPVTEATRNGSSNGAQGPAQQPATADATHSNGEITALNRLLAEREGTIREQRETIRDQRERLDAAAELVRRQEEERRQFLALLEDLRPQPKAPPWWRRWRK